jgi:hypothetical protein
MWAKQREYSRAGKKNGKDVSSYIYLLFDVLRLLNKNCEAFVSARSERRTTDWFPHHFGTLMELTCNEEKEPVISSTIPRTSAATHVVKLRG